MGRRVLFGSYELLERIGEGGMAEVWRARSRGVAGFEKTVVIKRVLPSLMARQDFASLLIREAKIAALLNHPNVVQIFDLGEEQGAYFIAMEYVHGCDLATAISHQPDVLAVEDGAGLNLALRVWIAAEAAKALDYAHRRRAEDGRPLQIVHRDVSPQNVLLGYEGQIKVADFGIALADQRGLGREESPGVLRGKYAYMSPEQARAEPLDRRSDVFALGIVLHEMLAGKRLFRGKSRKETLRNVELAEIPPIDVQALGGPPLLAEVVTHALARSRDERYPSAGAMAEDLSRVLVEMSAHVGPTELTEALLKIAPPDDARRVNKIRVDVLARSGEDAHSAAHITHGATPRVPTDPTRAFPTSQRMRTTVRPGVVLTLREPEPANLEDLRPSKIPADGILPGSLESIEVAATTYGGMLVPSYDGVVELVFGIQQDLEQASDAAVRCALELHAKGHPTCVLQGGDVRVFETSPPLVEPLATTHERGKAHLDDGPHIWLDPALEPDLGSRFVVEPGTGWPMVRGYRRRSEREMGGLRRDPLVGRRSLMRRIAKALVEVERGHGRALMLIGGPGVGKSRLLAEVRASLEPAGALFVVTNGREAQVDTSFDALAVLLRDLCGEDDAGEGEAGAPSPLEHAIERLKVLGLSPREVGRAKELAGLPTEVADRAGRPRGLEIVVLLRKALRALSTDRPVVLCLEDVHWMDDGTRQVLDLLLAGLRTARVLVLLTARPGNSLPHLHVETLAVHELDLDAGARVFAHRVGARGLEDELAQRLHESVDGNPGWINVLADGLRESGRLEVCGSLVHGFGRGELPVPDRMHARVQARIGALGARARGLVQITAAFPEPLDVATLAAIEGVPRDVAEPIVQRLISRRVLRAATEDRGDKRESEVPWIPSADAPLPARVRIYGGELVRRAVLESLSTEHQQRVHAKIADVLRRSGAANDDRVETLAYHSARAGDFERAPSELERAAEVALARGEHGTAARRFLHASELLLGEMDAADRRAALCARAAEVALEAGATALAATALAAAPPVTDEHLDLRLGLAHIAVLTRREQWSEALRRVEELSHRLDRSEDSIRGRAQGVLGQARLQTGDVAGAVLAFHEAVRTFESIGDGQNAGRALSGLAIALARAGESERAGETGMAALVSAVRHGGAELRCNALMAAAEIAEASGDDALAASRWCDAAHVAHDAELEVLFARTAARAAIACVHAGLDSEAAVWADDSARVARAHDLDAVESVAEAVQATLALQAHPEPHFVKALVRSVEHLEQLGRFGSAAMVLQMLARGHLALDDVGAAIRTLGRAGPLAEAAGRPLLHARLRAEAEALARGEHT